MKVSFAVFAAALVTAAVGIAVIPARAVTFVDVPAREVSLTTDLPALPTDTTALFSFADGNTVLLLELQDFRLLALRSTDGGAAFGGERVVAGGPGGRDVVWAAATRAPDGRVYVALVSPVPDGGLGLRLVWTPDLGITWHGPYDALEPGDLPTLTHVYPALMPQLLSIAANAAGRVSIAFPTSRTAYYYVVSSPDAGLTWTAPARIDGVLEPPSTWMSLNAYAPRLAVAVDHDDVVHAAWVRTTAASTNSGKVFYARSLDGGVTFTAEASLSDLYRLGQYSRGGMDLAVTDGGALLVAISEPSSLAVLRSTDHGASFTTTLSAAVSYTYAPRLATAGSEVLVLASNLASDGSTGQLFVARSGNGGATFGSPATIATYVAPMSAAAARTTGGTWLLAFKNGAADTTTRTRAQVHVSSTVNGSTWSAPVRLDAAGGTGHSDRVLPAIVSTAADEAFVAWADGRDDNDAAQIAYGAKGVAATTQFGPEGPLAFSRMAANPQTDSPDVVTDAAGRVYVAYGACVSSRFWEIVVRRSLDGGHTFGPPVVAASSATVSGSTYQARLLPGAAGRLYLLYVGKDAAGTRRIRFKASADGGIT